MIYTVFDVVLSMLRIPFTGSGYKRLSMKRFKTRKTKNRRETIRFAARNAFSKQAVISKILSNSRYNLVNISNESLLKALFVRYNGTNKIL